SEVESLLTSGIVITGGGSNLAGMSDIAEQVFNVPVRVGLPRSIAGLKDLINAPEHSVATGLILYGAEHGANKRRLGMGMPVSGIFRKVANWLGEHF
ncbi:MAG: cell division protein FtsA, partial [SAR324 cluster bacterium]|nr:cell division protein FtsA [SAR324 cluster bacterium]